MLPNTHNGRDWPRPQPEAKIQNRPPDGWQAPDHFIEHHYLPEFASTGRLRQELETGMQPKDSNVGLEVSSWYLTHLTNTYPPQNNLGYPSQGLDLSPPHLLTAVETLIEVHIK